MSEDEWWAEVMSSLPPEVAKAIYEKMNPPPRFARFRAWLNKPRGFSAVVAAQGESMAQTLKMIRGYDPRDFDNITPWDITHE